jgi:stage V sporulation protein D (sporulation-specific penicillin-binding protein)
MQREYEYYETKYIKIPNVVGMSKKEGIKLLKDFKIEYSGEGDTIVYTSPKEGTYIKKDGIIKIMLGN